MSGQPIALGHALPTYHLREAAGERRMQRADDGSGDFVHALHVQVLAERIILARENLKQGKTGAARELLDEACAWLAKTSHAR